MKVLGFARSFFACILGSFSVAFAEVACGGEVRPYDPDDVNSIRLFLEKALVRADRGLADTHRNGVMLALDIQAGQADGASPGRKLSCAHALEVAGVLYGDRRLLAKGLAIRESVDGCSSPEEKSQTEGCDPDIAAYRRLCALSENAYVRTIRPGGGEMPFWNSRSTMFMYPPAFDFKPVQGASNYVFRVYDANHTVHEFESDEPTAPLTPVWRYLPAGHTTVVCLARRIGSSDVLVAGERNFWRQEPFHPLAYPRAGRTYAEAFRKVGDYLCARPEVSRVVACGQPDISDRSNFSSYPSKMLSEVVMVALAAGRMREAKAAAECLIADREPAGTPLEFFTQTYRGDGQLAGKYRGQHMLSYPAAAGGAFVALWKASGERKYLDAAEAIARTYMRLQDDDGTWALKMSRTGAVVSENRLVPNPVIDFMEGLHEVTGVAVYRECADRAFRFLDEGPLRNWNWEGQFEDIAPAEEPYRNLTSTFACDTARYLLRRFPGDVRRLKQARELLRFAEDQFVVWNRPCDGDGVGTELLPYYPYVTWRTPAVLEQYACYNPIDASAAAYIRACLALWRADGDVLALAKAKALGDSAVNNQDESGRIRTYWISESGDSHDPQAGRARTPAGGDWFNCMAATARALRDLADAETPSTPFVAAKPVWPKGYAGASNVQVRFTAEFAGGGRCCLRVTGADAYRIRLNGRHAGYGPARGPKGFFRVDEWPLAASNGRNWIEIEVQGNNCCNFYFAENHPFFQAEIIRDDAVVAATAATNGGFVASLTERVRKVPRYSFQRAFAEVYRLNGRAEQSLGLEECDPVRYLERIAPYPSFCENRHLKLLSSAAVSMGKRREHDAKLDEMAGEVEFNSWDDLLRLRFNGRKPTSGPDDGEVRLECGRSVMFDAGLNDCGFYGMTVEVLEPGRLILDFDEVLDDAGEINSTRLSCCNAVEWIFDKKGRYQVETFEPYVWRYANLSSVEGCFKVSDRHVRTYKNGSIGKADFRCSDPALEKVFKAAQETFAQNAVDVFTDCPSRERAGWLCDSFFLGRMNALFCGTADLERLFLQNYALPESFDYIPRGMVPMCYPAAQPNGGFISNWAMWLVIESEEYLARSGDRRMIQALKPRFLALLDYLRGFQNSDGLLERLQSWVFVEWSKCNQLVQDVNYPTNMTFAEMLSVLDRLYGMPELAAEAERIRATVRRQSWTGRWFCDNAVRQQDGSLKLSGECTETCQYYAFFFRTATPESHSELWRTLVRDFGPGRKKTQLHPEIWPSNAFIGNYLRLELLSRAGLTQNILDETKGFFLYMADRTGTLWEHDSTYASCCHGFASHAAMYLYRDLLGVREIDRMRKRIVFRPARNTHLRFCEGTLPLSSTETVRLGWKREGDRVVVTERLLPKGWTLVP